MTDVTAIGIDISKSVFQVCWITADGDVVIRRPIRKLELLFRCLMPTVLIERMRHPKYPMTKTVAGYQ